METECGALTNIMQPDPLRGESGCHYSVSSAHKVHNMSLLKRFDTHSNPMGCVTGKPPAEALIGSLSSSLGFGGGKLNHVFVCLICISIAVLSSQWFVFKHEVGLFLGPSDSDQ